MKGSEFIRRLRRLGRQRQIPVEVHAERGKGSHRLVFFGTRRTVLRDPKDELKKGTLHAMLRQLGINVQDFERG